MLRGAEALFNAEGSIFDTNAGLQPDGLVEEPAGV